MTRVATRLALALASGLAVGAAFPGIGLAPAAWIGLVPLLLAVRGVRPGRAFGYGAAAGATFFFTTTSWLVAVLHRAAMPQPLAAVLLAACTAVCAVQFGLFASGVAWDARRRDGERWWWPAALWVALEALRARAVWAGGWALLGYSQYANVAVLPVASVTGVTGISALVVAVNAAIAQLLAGERRRSVAALAVVAVGTMGIGQWPPPATPAAGLRVAAVHVDARERAPDGTLDGWRALAAYEAMTRTAQRDGVELIVWPESALPFLLQDPGDERERVLALARRGPSHLLVGGIAYRRAAGRSARSNRAFLISPAGQEVGAYDRRRLMPFGEYVPWRSLMPTGLRPIVAPHDLASGTDATVLRIGDHRIGTLMCLESVFPDLARDLVHGGAEMLVNLANDAWFPSPAGREQHLMHAVLRAVETGIPVVRVASGGTSAFIGADGHVSWRATDEATEWHSETLTAAVRRTVYARTGDWFPWACIAMVLLTVAPTIRGHVRPA
jgi:apolipoprotein N-acyltransferase